jgi:transketolase
MGITMEDLQNFRQFGSKTPGHPEYGHTAGIETTTGPLGQGIANAVGMALAEAHLAAKYNKPGYDVVDHYTYAICGDGCLEEGISYEACSFAGANNLGKLILFYDDNDITIEGDTDITFKEDIPARFASQNWQVLHVDFVASPDDIELLANAVKAAQACKDKPSIIIGKTHIGYGSPLEGSAKSHGAPLGAENLAKSKEKLGWSYLPSFALRKYTTIVLRPQRLAQKRKRLGKLPIKHTRRLTLHWRRNIKRLWLAKSLALTALTDSTSLKSLWLPVKPRQKCLTPSRL